MSISLLTDGFAAVLKCAIAQANSSRLAAIAVPVAYGLPTYASTIVFKTTNIASIAAIARSVNCRAIQ